MNVIIKNALLPLAICIFVCGHALSAPHINKTLQTSGLIVYQDHSDENQFFYIPANVPVILGSTLEDFKTTYWGIARPFHDESSGKSLFGATVTGRAQICASESQLNRATNAIKNAFNVERPRISPIRMQGDVQVRPVWAASTLAMGSTSDVVFPNQVAFCQSFQFAFGTGNSLFANYVATEAIGSRQQISNPDFGVNIVGKAQFETDPWKAKCSADLSQVWSYIRRQHSASARVGWFKLGSADYLKIVQDLQRDAKISCTFSEGDWDLKQFGYQVFNMVKDALTELNTHVAAGEGFFRFEPLPNPETVSAEGASVGWGWGLSVNSAYSENHFSQSITWEKEIEYRGRILQDVPTSMTLAVRCNRATENYFAELTDPRNPCISPRKAESFLDRRDREMGYQNQARQIVQERYDSGQYSRNDFERIIDELSNKSLQEDLQRRTFDQSIFGQQAASVDMDSETKYLFSESLDSVLEKLEKKIKDKQ
ncbi:MAG: hypothetical protein ACFHVJ_10045 [Aestuariibacter sp.]